MLSEYETLFSTFQQYMAAYFEQVQQLPEYKGNNGQYANKPHLGLRLDLGQQAVVVISPGWTTPTKEDVECYYSPVLERQRKDAYYDHSWYERNGEKWYVFKTVTVKELGVIHGERVEIEFLNPGRQYEVWLKPGEVRASRYYDFAYCRERLDVIADVARRMMLDPLDLFASCPRNRCACCHKALTDPDSRNRGYGPECLKRMEIFKRLPKRIPAVEQWRQKYFKETGFTK